MAVNRGLFTSDRDDWETPDDLYSRLDQEFGGIPLDVCAWDQNAKAPAWFTIFDDALSLDWAWVLAEVLGLPAGRRIAWMNPPYGRQIGAWVAKAAEEGQRGVTVVTLLPARTDTAWWHDYIWDEKRHRPRPGVEVRLLRGRLRFVGAANGAPFPSAVVIFGGQS